jgi:ADP-heptose:LPS heptosyltransferase
MASGAPTREIAFDCRFFIGDRPCKWHKTTGVICRCDHYEPIVDRLLIIKLDAMGDVLRTTALLPALAQAHPQAAITWITRRESRPLLERNPYLAEVLIYGEDALVQLQARTFDRVINLDAGRTSAALASAARSLRKDGFMLDERGVVQATNEAARDWLQLGVFDDLKRKNARTYQDLMADIVGLAGCAHRYVFELSDDERAQGRIQLERLGVDFSRPVIGLNTGAGRRWQLKQWREDGYLELIERLARGHDAQFVLLGGPDERERHARLQSQSVVPLVDGGCDNGGSARGWRMRQPGPDVRCARRGVLARHYWRHACHAPIAGSGPSDCCVVRPHERLGNRALRPRRESDATNGVSRLLQADL